MRTAAARLALVVALGAMVAAPGHAGAAPAAAPSAIAAKPAPPSCASFMKDFPLGATTGRSPSAAASAT